MTRRTDLETAETTHVKAIAVYEAIPDKAKKPDQWRKLAINQRSLLSIRAELAKQPPVEPAPTSAPEPTPPPVIPGDAAAKSRAWNRLEATDNINAVFERSGLGDTATKEERRAALGDGLFAQAIALGQFGSPYWGPGDADTDLSPEVYAVGDLAGGFWGRRSGLDNKLTPGFYQRIYNASKLVAEVLTPSYMSAEDAHALALANGLNEEETGPA